MQCGPETNKPAKLGWESFKVRRAAMNESFMDVKGRIMEMNMPDGLKVRRAATNESILDFNRRAMGMNMPDGFNVRGRP